jgi:hypothetical protein
MRKRQDTKVVKSIDDLKCGMVVDDLLMCENLTRNRVA